MKWTAPPSSIIVANSKLVIADRVQVANTFLSKLKGLLGRRQLASTEALIIPRCNSVHMFFMRFPIDVLFCDRENRVLHINHNLRPWQVSSWIPGADFVVELSAGRAKELGIAEGDLLEFN